MFDEKLLTTLPEGTAETVSGKDGGEIFSLCAGEGPTIVLAHGYLADMTIFNIVFHGLVAEGYRVIAFDQRGFGRSRAGSDGIGSAAMASDYAAVLDHYEVEQGTLVGHSMGVFLSIVFCLLHPETASRRLERMVLVSGNAGDVAKGSLQNRLQTPLLKSGLLKLLWSWPSVGRALVGQIFGTAPDPRFVELTRKSLLKHDIAHTLPIVKAMTAESYYERLGEIPIRTRVICGERDGTCPRWHSERLGTDIPQATNRWLPEVGHMVVYEAPDAIIDAIRN